MKSKNCRLGILTVILAYITSQDFCQAVNSQYYVTDSVNNNDKSCLYDDPCKTLDAFNITNNINIPSPFTVYILDIAGLYSELIISDSTSPRTLTNNPQETSTLSQLVVNNNAKFTISGLVHIQNISFQYYQDETSFVFNVVSQDTASLTLISCVIGHPTDITITQGGFVSVQQGILLCDNITVQNRLAQQLFSVSQTASLIRITNSNFQRLNNMFRGTIQGTSGELLFEFNNYTNTGRITSNWFPSSDIYLNILEGGHALVQESLFNYCFTDIGGVIQIYIHDGGQALLKNITVLGCYASVGGAINALLESQGVLTIDGCQFTDCHASQAFTGGAIYAKIDGDGADLILKGEMKFENCSGDQNWNEGIGGGMYVFVNGTGSTIHILGQLDFDYCGAGLGGGLYIVSQYGASTEISNISLSNGNAQNGGGIYALSQEQGNLTLMNIHFVRCQTTYTGWNFDWGSGGCLYARSVGENSILTVINATFHESSSSNMGGGLYAQQSSQSQLVLSGILLFVDCQAGNGGGMFAQSTNSNGFLEINGDILFQNCRSNGGGGLYIDSQEAGHTIIKGKIEFDGCVASHGGGMYAKYSIYYSGGGILTISGDLTCICEFQSTSTLN
ncbi:MAG: hypothetical protein EZS28_030036 [Streblomastix strix]|uniref:Right handed beta helix domain-containing protein n=1 Tax=Streblomastix strix TaxID=222440 RepID=A0A5J4UVG2_9EUKA|nr:MAG: hypothetical protein EZS28_030036 [Streblomastix strix]